MAGGVRERGHAPQAARLALDVAAGRAHMWYLALSYMAWTLPTGLHSLSGRPVHTSLLPAGASLKKHLPSPTAVHPGGRLPAVRAALAAAACLPARARILWLLFKILTKEFVDLALVLF